MSLAQLIWTMNKICKIRGLNPDHHQKKRYKTICSDISKTIVLHLSFPSLLLDKNNRQRKI